MSNIDFNSSVNRPREINTPSSSRRRPKSGHDLRLGSVRLGKSAAQSGNIVRGRSARRVTLYIPSHAAKRSRSIVVVFVVFAGKKRNRLVAKILVKNNKHASSVVLVV